MINTVEHNGKTWVIEEQEGHLFRAYALKEHLYSDKSEFQEVDVVDTEFHGRMLLNDRLVMVSEKDEFVYHDMICHVPMFVHPNPKKVLIIGGGDGGTAREVLRHSQVEKCVMVEIDKMVVDACREFIPQTAKELGHPKLELIFADGLNYVAETREKFDVVLVDSSDPIGPATPLFGPDFYKNLYSILTDDGIVVSQGESPWYFSEMQETLLKIVNSQFPIAMIYNFNNLTYPGGIWSFVLGAKKYHPINDFDETRLEKSGLKFQYYNKDIHRAAFALPNHMFNKLKPYISEGS